MIFRLLIFRLFCSLQTVRFQLKHIVANVFSEGLANPVSTGAGIKDVPVGGESLSKDAKYGKENARTYGLSQPHANQKSKNIQVIGKSNKFMQALSLPIICNMNPRSVYNKVEEFHTFVEEEEVDLLLMSES